MPLYESSIELNRRYRDSDTQFEGVAAGLNFTRNGSEKVLLRAMVSNIPAEHWFDAAQLELLPGQPVGFSNGSE